jgi:hypothetical protein|tara:strand:+ start:69 stop:470 length:402 start_codon:yes stop_codon:yes gene_type:complete
MAKRGPKPKSASLHVVGNTHRPDRQGDPAPGEKGDIPNNPTVLVPARKLTQSQQKQWDRYIPSATWLELHDEPAATVWVCEMAEYMRSPKKFTGQKLGQMRILGDDLGLPHHKGNSKAARADQTKPNDEFFDD